MLIVLSHIDQKKESFSIPGAFKKITDEYGRIKYIKYPRPPKGDWKSIGSNLEGSGIGVANALIGIANVLIDVGDVIYYGAQEYQIPTKIHH